MSEAATPSGAPSHRVIGSWIRGRCPACGSAGTLFVGLGGHVTCSWVDCENPGFVVTLDPDRVAERDDERVCVCGEPGTTGVVHRTDGPCYHLDDFACPTHHLRGPCDRRGASSLDTDGPVRDRRQLGDAGSRVLGWFGNAEQHMARLWRRAVRSERWAGERGSANRDRSPHSAECTGSKRHLFGLVTPDLKGMK